MEDPVRVAPDTGVLPTPFPIPGLRYLYIDASVITGREPVLVGTGGSAQAIGSSSPSGHGHTTIHSDQLEASTESTTA